MSTNTKEKIRAFIKENMTIFEDDVTINDDDNIFEKGFVDSLFAMKLICYVENEFKINVSNDDLDLINFSSVNNMARFLKKKKNL